MTSTASPKPDAAMPDSRVPETEPAELSPPESAPSRAEPRSGEHLATLPSGVQICYETDGDPNGDPLLLVMGLGAHLTWWPPELCEGLAERGFYVIRFDNRDIGRSTRFREHRVTRSELLRGFLGLPVTVAYSLEDMAADGLGLLDALGIGAAHVAGVSMGGMIAQSMAIQAPDRVTSLTSIMSTTGSRRVGFQDPLLMPHMLRRGAGGREAYIANSVDFWQRISSPIYLDEPEKAGRRAEETWERGVTLSGVLRQMMAIITQTDRTEALGRLRMPVTVVHGLNDRMVHHSGGRATASAIPGSELLLVPGMGHDLPVGLVPTYIEAITGAASRAARRD